MAWQKGLEGIAAAFGERETTGEIGSKAVVLFGSSWTSLWCIFRHLGDAAHFGVEPAHDFDGVDKG